MLHVARNSLDAGRPGRWPLGQLTAQKTRTNATPIMLATTGGIGEGGPQVNRLLNGGGSGFISTERLLPFVSSCGTLIAFTGQRPLSLAIVSHKGGWFDSFEPVYKGV